MQGLLAACSPRQRLQRCASYRSRESAVTLCCRGYSAGVSEANWWKERLGAVRRLQCNRGTVPDMISAHSAFSPHRGCTVTLRTLVTTPWHHPTAQIGSRTSSHLRKKAGMGTVWGRLGKGGSEGPPGKGRQGKVLSPHGPFAAGFADLEWTEGPKRELAPDTHLVGRLFYPACKEAVAGRGGRAYKRPPWIPAYGFAYGIAVFVTGWMKQPRQFAMRALAQLVVYALGQARAIDVFEGAPVADGPEAFPVVLFSHGIGGARYLYSTFCTQLASAGFVVLAVEHADGTASAVKLADGAGWKFYSGWGDKEEQVRQTRWRLDEMRTAARLLRGLAQGTPHPRLALTGQGPAGAALRDSLAGRLNVDALSTAGHSYGGATAAALAAEDKDVCACVTYDPWWGALPPESAALSAWKTAAPILVLGSQTWNTPNAKGTLFCGAERQSALFAAAATRAGNGTSGGEGPGAVHLVLEGSNHGTFYDGASLLALRHRWILKRMGRDTGLDPLLGLRLVSAAHVAFLGRHARLPRAQARRCAEVALGGPPDRQAAASVREQRQGEASVSPPQTGPLQRAASEVTSTAVAGTLPLVEETVDATLGQNGANGAQKQPTTTAALAASRDHSSPVQGGNGAGLEAEDTPELLQGLGGGPVGAGDVEVLRRIAGSRTWKLDVYPGRQP